MNLSKDPSQSSVPWFWIGMAGVFLLSAFLRFWGLSRFNTLVFDEVYFAKYGNNYLTNTPFFDVHPPLGKYLIAVGIWLSRLIPFGNDARNELTGSLLSPWSYRWLNAFTGSLIPLVVGAIAYQLSHRRSYALIAALFMAADGLFLVESRYALINVYLIIFGLLGQLLFLMALNSRVGRRAIWLALSGICFGACVSVKWNGLGFLLGIYLVWISAWIIRWIEKNKYKKLSIKEENSAPNTSEEIPLQELENLTFIQKLTEIDFRHMLFELGAIPVVVYRLAWIPHIQLNPERGFWEMQKQILGYHQRVGGDVSIHPYCSAWYTWPWMMRPVGYFFEKVGKTPEPVSSLISPFPPSPPKVVYFDVHAMGNPALWWLSTVAIAILLLILSQRIIRATTNHNLSLVQSTEFGVALFLILNYVANLLPWVKVTRCAFLYHYMGAAIFAFLAIAWIVDSYLQSYNLWLRAVGVTIIFAILLAFVYWMPLYLGLPLSPESFGSRMWFRSWI
ncbi:MULTISPECIES: dolichyl-phosphate-mannose--protein mannosyltransferase [Cyanophyceae]|uniref:dolichyl-phosphate-mannose--protein mannosyltransferase n=1 Tax=Cyanophyceae TaxID=3028117 RepID=UPI001687E594|nr:phospholipid carrier-dependent glycosyltransferase [Trichocoleus sp. FACHB-40]MBD2003090.1 phospholipid carrier-dependent glycosyltransferase [Trichocoleus sp. FACHB-40]